MLVAEEVSDAGRAVLADELVELGEHAAGREAAPELGDALDVATKFNLFGEQSVASLAVLGALVGEAGGVLLRKGGSGSER